MKLKVILISIAVFFIYADAIIARSFEWTQKKREPGFSIDIPSDWEHNSVVRSNGALVSFRKDKFLKGAMIEVRALVYKGKQSFARLVDQKAARLAAEYSQIRMQEEGPSKFRNEMYFASWLLQVNHAKYIERTAFLVQEEYVLVVSCISSLKTYNNYRITFDNALLSIKFSNFDNDEEEDKEDDKDEDLSGLEKLKTLFVFNRPNSIRSIIPPKDAVISIEEIRQDFEKSKKGKKK